MYFFYRLENLKCNLRYPSITISLYAFFSPLCERNGKAVHIKGNPIISSTYRGLSWEVFPFVTFLEEGTGIIPLHAIAVRLFPFFALQG